MIGVAIDPEFARNQFVYVNHVVRKPYPHHRLSRFTARGDIAEPTARPSSSKATIRQRWAALRPNGHQGGAIHFGKDGKLYVAFGEQTAGAPSQAMDIAARQAAAIERRRLDPRRQPVLPKARGKYRAIWALGLRNPFTFAVQPETGRIFINDVGQSAWEEIDEGSPAQTMAGRRRRDQPRSHGSAGRSTIIRWPRSPAARFARPAHPTSFPAAISRPVLLRRFRQGLDQGPRPGTPGKGRDVRVRACAAR